MSAALTELRERRASTWEQMKSLLDESSSEGMSAEQNESYARMESEMVRLTSDLEARERAEALEKRMDAPRPTPAGVLPTTPDTAGQSTRDRTYRTAFKRYLRGGMRALDHNQAQALTEQAVDWGSSNDEQRALTVTTTGGGYLIPQDYLRDLVRRMLAFGAVQRVARTIQTDSGAAMPFPKVDDTGNVGAILAINTQVSEQDVAFTVTTLGAFMYTSKLIRVPFQLLQDSGFDIDDFLADILAERVARILNAHFTTGAGTTEPLGLVTGGTTGKTAAATTAFTAGELIDLVHSVNSAYRNSGRARFMLGDARIVDVRKMADDNNNFLWQPGLQQGVPDTILGFPYEVNDQMPAATAGLSPVAFGDFYSGYIIRQVKGFSLLRLEERYADYLQVGFLGYARYDGAPRDTNAYRLLTMAAA